MKTELKNSYWIVSIAAFVQDDSRKIMHSFWATLQYLNMQYQPILKMMN